MKIDVASSDDLAALYVAYLELCARGRPETLEIAVAPGEYGVASIGPIRLDLGGDLTAKDPQVDVIVRGTSRTRAAVFRDLGILASARSLRLEQLVMIGRRAPLLEARVARELALESCVIARNEWGGPWGGALMRVTGVHGQPAYSVEISDCWFAGNGSQSEAALLAIAPATGSYVESVVLRRVAFLDNRMHSDLLVHEARTIHADEVLAVKDGLAGAAVLRFARADQVVIQRSAFAVDDPAAIAAEDTRTWHAGWELRGSRVYVTGARRELPAGARGDADFVDGAPVVARRAALAAAIAALSSDGRIPDGRAEWARMRSALGMY